MGINSSKIEKPISKFKKSALSAITNLAGFVSRKIEKPTGSVSEVKCGASTEGYRPLVDSTSAIQASLFAQYINDVNPAKTEKQLSFSERLNNLKRGAIEKLSSSVEYIFSESPFAESLTSIRSDFEGVAGGFNRAVDSIENQVLNSFGYYSESSLLYYGAHAAIPVETQRVSYGVGDRPTYMDDSLIGYSLFNSKSQFLNQTLVPQSEF